MAWWWYKDVPEDASVEELQRALEDNKKVALKSVKRSETSKEKATKIIGLAQGSLDILGRLEKEKNK